MSKGKYIMIGKPTGLLNSVGYWMKTPDSENVTFGQTMVLALKDYECRGAVLFNTIHPLTIEENEIIHTLLK